MKNISNYAFFCINATYLTLVILGLFGKLDVRTWFPVFCLWVGIDAVVDLVKTGKEIVNEY